MEDTQARERVRSPNYPAFGLATATERVATLYKRDGKAAAHVGAAIKAWGYGSLNGRSLGVLGALRQYGLLEDTGPKMVRLSPLALTIQLAPSDSPERFRALQEAARRPKIFQDLFEQYADGFPSDETMVRNLALSTTFSEEAATKVIAAFRETIDLLEQVGSVDTSRDTAKGRDESDDGRRAPDQRPKQQEVTMSSVAVAGHEDYAVPLGKGRKAIVRLPHPFSESDYQQFLKVLDAMKAGLVDDVPPVEPDGGQ